MFAAIRDAGGRSGSYEGEMARAREAAFGDMQAQASELGADAIVGIDIDYEVLEKRGQ